MKRYVLIAATVAAAVLSSCKKDSFAEPSYENGLSLSVEGTEIFRYDELTWQASAGTDNVFTMQSDDGTSWYELACEDCPVETGQELYATVSWEKAGDGKSRRLKNLSFRVSSVDVETGMIHLWSQEKGVAVMIHAMR